MVQIKQYKKCGSCRFFKGGHSVKCELGYSLKNGTILYGVICDGIPTEPCAKTLKASDYYEALNNYKK